MRGSLDGISWAKRYQSFFIPLNAQKRLRCFVFFSDTKAVLICLSLLRISYCYSRPLMKTSELMMALHYFTDSWRERSMACISEKMSGELNTQKFFQFLVFFRDQWLPTAYFSKFLAPSFLCTGSNFQRLDALWAEYIPFFLPHNFVSSWLTKGRSSIKLPEQGPM